MAALGGNQGKLRERKGRYEGLMREMERTGQSQVSLSDPDSRAMPKSPKVDVGYNAQVAVDDMHKLFVVQEATNAQLVRDIKQALPHLPVILGGHTTHDNVARRLAEADGVFVGSCLKSDRWDGRVDVERVRAYVNIVERLG